MTKSELIKELEKVPDDANLYILNLEHGEFDEVVVVSQMDAFTQGGALHNPWREDHKSVAVKIWVIG